MTNPLTYGSVAVLPNGPAQVTDSLTALASGAAKPLGLLDFSSAPVFDCNIAPMKVKSNASGVSSTGLLTVYVLTSEDNSIWTDGISPTATTDQSAAIAVASVACQINVVANGTTYYTPEFSLFALLGFMPKYASVMVRNQSGAALDGTAGNFSAKYMPITYT